MIRIVILFLLLFAAPEKTFSGERSSLHEQGRESLRLDESATFKNWGLGAMSCASYVEARALPESPVGPYDATFRQWLMGFTTAFNLQNPATTDLLGHTSVERAMKWIEGYCRKNGNAEFFTAVWEFTKMAYPYRAKPDINIVRN